MGSHVRLDLKLVIKMPHPTPPFIGEDGKELTEEDLKGKRLEQVQTWLNWQRNGFSRAGIDLEWRIDSIEVLDE